MNVCAVIVTYNAMRWVDKSISSLYCSTSPPEHVIVVDNSSSDGTPEFVAGAFPEVEIVRMGTNAGFAAAAQTGIDRAVASGADAVLLMHHDVWLASGALEALVACCSDDSLSVPVYMNGFGSGYETSFRPVIRHSYGLRRFLERGAGSSTVKIHVKDVPSGCWFLPVALIRETGPLNRIFTDAGPSAEEYLARTRYLSKRTYVVPGAIIFHDRDSYGDRTLFDVSSIYNDLLLIECNPGSCALSRAAAKALLFFRLVFLTVHYRVNLLSVYRDDLHRVKSLRCELKVGRKKYRSCR